MVNNEYVENNIDMLLILYHKLTPMRGSKQVEKEHIREVVSRTIFVERVLELFENKNGRKT